MKFNDNLNIDNVFERYLIAEEIKFNDLKENCVKFIRENKDKAREKLAMLGNQESEISNHQKLLLFRLLS